MLYFLSEKHFVSYDGIQSRKLFEINLRDVSAQKIVKDELNNPWFYSIEDDQVKAHKV